MRKITNDLKSKINSDLQRIRHGIFERSFKREKGILHGRKKCYEKRQISVK